VYVNREKPTKDFDFFTKILSYNAKNLCISFL
jgi:hypothetical protein